MKKLTIAFAHAFTWRWTSIAVHALRKFPFPMEHEIIVVNNSPEHPSIKCLTETRLGEGVKIINGDPELPSHGQALSLAYEACDSDWFFTSESDALPITASWGAPYIRSADDFDYIGPYMSLAGGRFIHPCGAMANRKVIEQAKAWRAKYPEWIFINSAAPELGLDLKGYHVSCTKEFWSQANLTPSIAERQVREATIWEKAGPWQEMLSFTDDSFDSYWMRELPNLSSPTKEAYLRVGYEPGQHLSGFALQNFKCLKAPFKMEWIPGFHDRQAAYSDVFGVFRHVWCGTSSFSPAIAPEVRAFKMSQMDMHFLQLPEDLRNEIIAFEEKYP